MRPEELTILVNGMDLSQARPRRNWLRRAPAHELFLAYLGS